MSETLQAPPQAPFIDTRRRGADPPLSVAACTRFNTKTWQEYQDWKQAHQHAYEQIYQRPLKCIYGSPREMSHTKMPPHAKILVIEMNNDENQIQGIGVIQNQTASEVYRKPPTTQSTAPVPDHPNFRIFSDRNYTRYIYIGNEYYATREELERNHTPDAQYINEQLASMSIPAVEQDKTHLQIIAQALFKGATHMKRGSGITKINAKLFANKQKTSI